MSARCVLGLAHVTSRSILLLGSRDGPGDHTARQRGAHASARETQSRGGSLDGIDVVSNRKSARVKISTQAPPPKSLEVEPGNEASQDDVSLSNILDDVLAHHQWMM